MHLETQVFESPSQTSIVVGISGGIAMQRISARQAEKGFGGLIDLARVQSLSIEKHESAAGAALAAEEYERLSANEDAKNQGAAAGRR